MLTSAGKRIVLLKVTNLNVFYGQAIALREATFLVKSGEIVAMLGPNGAGKSTALKAISGVLPETGGHISEGDVVFREKSILGLRTDQLARKGISLVPEGRRIFPTMTVMENLEMGGYLLNQRKVIKDRIGHILTLFAPLKNRLRQKAGTLSGGEQQMLSLGRALMLEPVLLLVDEPSLGLSPNFVEMLFVKLQEINQSGTSILLVEQNARLALEICHRAYLFEIGSISLVGTQTELMNSGEARHIFFGGN